jgi:hypothetical protein
MVRLIALVAALAVAGVGIAYIELRSRDYESTAELSVNPQSGSADTQANLLGNLQESGTIGTRVELISSQGTLDAAGNPPVQIAVRSVPDTRVIDVKATGAEDKVGPGLTDIVNAAKKGDSKLGDPWRMRVIASPTAAALAGPSDALLAAATGLLAILAAVAVLAGLRALDLSPGERRPTSPPEPMRPAGGNAPAELRPAKAGGPAERVRPGPSGSAFRFPRTGSDDPGETQEDDVVQPVPPPGEDAPDTALRLPAYSSDDADEDDESEERANSDEREESSPPPPKRRFGRRALPEQ